MKHEIESRVMYEVLAPYKDRFEADQLKFTPDFMETKAVADVTDGAEVWKITYEGLSWKRWKEEKILSGTLGFEADQYCIW